MLSVPMMLMCESMRRFRLLGDTPAPVEESAVASSAPSPSSVRTT
jgi:hypothetical protein